MPKVKLLNWLLFVVVFLFSPVFQATAQSNDPDRPNLLVIYTDEHNFRTLGCYRDQLPEKQAHMWGDPVVETPHIDSIAEEGALADSFYANTPVCSPSGASLVSGMYPHETDVHTNNIPLNESITTWAHVLRDSGYETGWAGKYHVAGTAKPGWNPDPDHGFTHNSYMFNRGHWKVLHRTLAGPAVKPRDGKGRPTYSMKGANKKTFTTDFLTDRAIEFITAHKDQPFAYVVSFPDPHGPDRVREPYDSMYDDADFEKPHTFDAKEKSDRNIPPWTYRSGKWQPMADYYGMVKCIDDNVGRLLETMEKQGVLEDTVVVFTSDHGDLRGEHGRQNKGPVLEASARVPFVVRYPEKISPGTIVDTALGTADVMPTLLSLMNVTNPVSVSGEDASPLFTGDASPEEWSGSDVEILRSTGLGKGWLAAVTDRYKLVVDSWGNPDPVLFDLKKGPDELSNFLNKPGYQKIVRRLARKLLKYGRDHGEPRLKEGKKLRNVLKNLVEKGK